MNASKTILLQLKYYCYCSFIIGAHQKYSCNFPLKTVCPSSNVAFLINYVLHEEHSFLGLLGEECVGRVCGRRIITVIYLCIIYLILIFLLQSGGQDQERKKSKRRGDLYSIQTSLIVAALKKMLPIGLNMCTPGDQELISLAKTRYSHVSA